MWSLKGIKASWEPVRTYAFQDTFTKPGRCRRQEELSAIIKEKALLSLNINNNISIGKLIVSSLSACQISEKSRQAEKKSSQGTKGLYVIKEMSCVYCWCPIIIAYESSGKKWKSFNLGALIQFRFSVVWYITIREWVSTIFSSSAVE